MHMLRKREMCLPRRIPNQSTNSDFIYIVDNDVEMEITTAEALVRQICRVICHQKGILCPA